MRNERVAFVGVAACLAACANIWGFQDLNEGDAAVDVGGDDGAMPMADAETSDATEPAETSVGDDATLVSDANDHKDASGVRDAARDASEASDANLSADAIAFMNCQKICSGGCCDSSGECISFKSQSPSVCGNGGMACVNCTKTQTGCITGPPCCGATSGKCDCSDISLVCMAP